MVRKMGTTENISFIFVPGKSATVFERREKLQHTKSKQKKHLASCYCAKLYRLAVESDHDEPPDGEGERQEDGRQVDHHGEVDMEHQEDATGKGVLD